MLGSCYHSNQIHILLGFMKSIHNHAQCHCDFYGMSSDLFYFVVIGQATQTGLGQSKTLRLSFVLSRTVLLCDVKRALQMILHGQAPLHMSWRYVTSRHYFFIILYNPANTAILNKPFNHVLV